MLKKHYHWILSAKDTESVVLERTGCWANGEALPLNFLRNKLLFEKHLQCDVAEWIFECISCSIHTEWKDFVIQALPLNCGPREILLNGKSFMEYGNPFLITAEQLNVIPDNNFLNILKMKHYHGIGGFVILLSYADREALPLNLLYPNMLPFNIWNVKDFQCRFVIFLSYTDREALPLNLLYPNMLPLNIWNARTVGPICDFSILCG